MVDMEGRDTANTDIDTEAELLVARHRIKSNSVRPVSIYRHTPVFRPQKLTVPHTVHNTATSPGRFGSTVTCEQRKKHSVMGSVYPPGSPSATRDPRSSSSEATYSAATAP